MIFDLKAQTSHDNPKKMTTMIAARKQPTRFLTKFGQALDDL